MAFVDAAVNLARVMVAVAAKSLSPPVWTSVALRATVFAAAVLTSAALRAMVFTAAVLTLWTFLRVPGKNFTHFAPLAPQTAARGADRDFF